MVRKLSRWSAALVVFSAAACLGQDAVLEDLYGRGVHAFFSQRTGQAFNLLNEAVKGGSRDPRRAPRAGTAARPGAGAGRGTGDSRGTRFPTQAHRRRPPDGRPPLARLPPRSPPLHTSPPARAQKTLTDTHLNLQYSSRPDLTANDGALALERRRLPDGQNDRDSLD